MTDSDEGMKAGSQGDKSLEFVEDIDARRELRRVFERVREMRAKADIGPQSGRVSPPLLVMLVSRRLACLYEMLVESGMERFDPDTFEVVTDRVLDANPDDWTGRHAVLVDDVVNVGSTLERRHGELSKLVGESGEVTVLVSIQNRGRVIRELVEPMGIEPAAKGGPIERSDQEMNRLALDLVACLYRSRTPYFTDFPIFKRIIAPQTALDDLAALAERWLAADVTVPADPSLPIVGENQRAYTFIPTNVTEDRIRGRAIPAAAKLAELFKVRAYADGGEDGSCQLRLVPICIPGAAMPRRLDDALEEVASALRRPGTGLGLSWRKWHPPAKHRLLQMYLSACVVAEFWEDLRAVGAEVGELGSDMLEADRLCTYFGPDEGNKVAKAFDLAVAKYRETTEPGPPQRERLTLAPESDLWRRRSVRERASMIGEFVEHRDPDRPEAGPPLPSPGKAARIMEEHALWVQSVLSVFGYVDRELERPQAAELKEDYSGKSSQTTRPADGRRGKRILDEGICLEELAEATGSDPASDDPWERALTSLAIDIGNDLGVAVPATVHRDGAGPVFRHYRTGEGAFMADRPRYLLRSKPGIDNIDAFTRCALGLPLTGRLEPDQKEQAEQWAQAEGERLRRTHPGDWIDEIWIGDVVAVGVRTFTAEFVSTIRKGDTRREKFLRRVLPKRDRPGVKKGARVRWPVYALSGEDGKVVSGEMRIVETRHTARP